MRTELNLPAAWEECRVAMTSLPWPAADEEMPLVDGVGSQVVSLFEPGRGAWRKRLLLLTESEKGLPRKLVVGSHPSATGQVSSRFSSVTVRVLKESLNKGAYIYRECEAVVKCGAAREVTFRLGLSAEGSIEAHSENIAWWQWVQVEELWAGEIAEAWRIGGHLVPYGATAEGRWENKGHHQQAQSISQHCGDSLHGDLYIVVWKSGLIQVTAHFNSGYFHHWPKAIPAMPVVYAGGLVLAEGDTGLIDSEHLTLGAGASDRLSFKSCASFFANGHSGVVDVSPTEVCFAPWSDLRILASKDLENERHYLPPELSDVLPPGVARSFWFTIGLDGIVPEVARYQVPASWYEHCGELGSSGSGPGAEMAGRTVALMREHTQRGGIDTGMLWRYLRRDQRENRPYQDGPEWDATAASGLFTYAYQLEEDPSTVWEMNLQHAYHAADVSVYHGSWMPRLECSAELTAPISKYRVSGMVHGYLETGDPYLLEMARSVLGVYMAAEWANEPREYIGRDAYPITGMMVLWDYTADHLYLDFAHQTIKRLVASQNEDGGFSGQGGIGVFSGQSCVEASEDIGFACGLLSPLAIVEWAIRDTRGPRVAGESLRLWCDLMLRVQPGNGVWLSHGSKGDPYALICAAAMGSITRAGDILKDPRCARALATMLETMNATGLHVAGTHAYLAPLYAHIADRVSHQR